MKLTKTLYLEKLTVTFDGFKALDSLSLYVDPGELLCVIGPNGAGKTTMMDVITGKTRPDSGTAWFGRAVDLLALTEPEIAQAGIGRKFQKPSVFEFLTVFENLELALTGDKSFWKALVARLTSAQRERIDKVLETIGLATLRDSKRRRLSHGQKQWLEIGMLLMQEPRAVAGGRTGCGNDAAGDRAYRGAARLARRRSLGGRRRARYGLRAVDCQARHSASRRERAGARQHGRRAERSACHRSVSGDMSVLSVTGLNQFYGGSHTLWDVSLDVPAGSRTCLMGRNGMGKTTLLKCIMGLLPAASGEILFDGHDLRPQPAETRARLGIGYVPQGREIFPQLTVEENLQVGPAFAFAGSGGRFRPARDLPRSAFPVLKTMRHRRGGDLSGGQQQQLAIGRALVIEPTLLILDEPTEGIQPNIVHEIGDIILRLNKEMGLTVLLVEQKLPFARRVASEFRILEKGRCIAGGAIGALTDDLVHAHLSV